MYKMSYARAGIELSWDSDWSDDSRSRFTPVLIPTFILMAGYFHLSWVHGQTTNVSLSSVVSTSHKDYWAWNIASLTC